MVTLYHSPQSRSVRPRWLLEELGIPYELKSLNLQNQDQKRPEYLKLNPNGAVPTLVDGDLVLWESAAIVMYLADKYPEKQLAPAVGTPARAKYYQWVQYAMNGIEPPAVAIFLNTILKPEAERIPQVIPEARTQLGAAVKVVDDALVGRDYLLGAQFSAADVMVGSTISWAQMMGLVGPDRPNVASYLARLAARPAFGRAQAD
jgi:glutathione S-transferase